MKMDKLTSATLSDQLMSGRTSCGTAVSLVRALISIQERYHSILIAASLKLTSSNRINVFFTSILWGFVSEYKIICLALTIDHCLCSQLCRNQILIYLCSQPQRIYPLKKQEQLIFLLIKLVSQNTAKIIMII